MKKIYSLCTGIFTLLGLVVLLTVLFFNISTRLSVKKIQRGGRVDSGYAAVIIRSGSMEPAVSVDDMLIIQGMKSYQKGDIITYLSENGTLVTHRVVAVEKDAYITQGDANNTQDETVEPQWVVGKVVHILAGAGGQIAWLLSPLSIFLSFCFFLLLWLLGRIRR